MTRPCCWYQNFWLCDLDLDFWPTFEKNLTLAITFEPKEIGFNNTQVYSLWQDLSVDTKIFDFVTLTLTFALLLKKLNPDHNFLTKRDRVFIFHMCISCGKTFLSKPNFLTPWPWPWLLTYFWKKLNLDHNFWTKSDRALILHMFIPCDKTFLLIPIFLT